MGERRRIVFGAVVTVLLAAFGWHVLRPHEPLYEGRPLSLWLREAISEDGYRLPAPSSQASNAVTVLGAAALPILLEMVSTRDTDARRVLNHFALAFSFLHLPRQEGKAVMAAWGFAVLGATAKPAVPTLVRLLDDRDPSVRIGAARALGGLGRVASEAVPALIVALNRSPGPAWQDVALRDAAAGALSQMGAAAAPAIPHLAALTNVLCVELALLRIRGDSLLPFIDRLKDRSDPRRWIQAARLVADLGTNAEPAIPLLLSALSSTNHSVQEQGLYAITRIQRRPDLCLPPTIALLDSPEPNVRYRALFALRVFAKDARPAIPAIRRCIETSSRWMWVQMEATNTIRAIAADTPVAVPKPVP